MRRSHFAFLNWAIAACAGLLCAIGACAGDGAQGADYLERYSSAQTRAGEAACACWPADLQKPCLEAAAIDLGCDEARARSFADAYPAYARCLAGMVEQEARCLEEASCPIYPTTCAHDARTDCGSVPADLDARFAACLPPFQCETGQRIGLWRRCDEVRDCFDGSDERNCP
jgi:hypothetical protein